MSDPTLAFYTCFFGSDTNWANVISTPPDGYDCYYFTNNQRTYDRLASTKWKRVFVPIPISEDNVVSAQQTKHLRCCPNAYPELKPYQYLCWIDSKLQFTDMAAFQAMFTDLKTTDHIYAFTHHPLAYTSVWDEYNLAMTYEKYARQQEQAKAYIQSRLAAGYSETKPLQVACGFHLSKRGPLAEEIGAFWYSEISVCGVEDQISFQFVHQKYEPYIVVFPTRCCWKHL
jgi:Protein of unknown function (DUF616)